MYKVMIVDDNMTNLIMAKKALENEYEIVPVSSGETALEFLADMPEPPDLILLDVDMPKVNGFQVISEIKCSQRLNKIPVIFLTAQDDDTTEVEGFFLGATDYIKKPYTTALLRKRLEVHIQLLEQQKQLEDYNDGLSRIVQDKIHSLAEMQYGVVSFLVELMSKCDAYIGAHAKRVERYFSVFMQAIIQTGRYPISEEEGEIIVFASKIHDVGILFTPDACLKKNDELLLNEQLQMQNHTLDGAEVVSKLSAHLAQKNFMQYAFDMCRSHHERWDGKGYPDKLVSTAIPLEARALAIVDNYDEFRTRNSNHGVLLSHADAMKRVQLWKRTYFDPDLVEIFMSISEELEKLEV